MIDYDTKYNEYINLIESSLELYCKSENELLQQAMLYSLVPGGKRLRAALCLAVCDMLQGDVKEAVPAACAIEMIHAYSLIHDDLPAMDNDTLRRGKPTNHIVYGEAMAILAGDGLLSLAFELLTLYVINGGTRLIPRLNAAHEIIFAAGVNGMVAGQAFDIQSENKAIGYQELKKMHKLKTGALIAGACVAGAYIADATSAEIETVRLFGENLGLAFQISDDILDHESSSEVLGKTPGKDKLQNKATYVNLFGLEKSRKMLQDAANTASEYLMAFNGRNEFLVELTNRIVTRNK